jgi:hypothetical protein
MGDLFSSFAHPYTKNVHYIPITLKLWGRHGHDHMVIGFTTTYAISAYHN